VFIDLCNNLGRSLTLGKQRRNDVLLIHPRQSDKRIRLLDSFLDQEIVIRSVAVNDRRFREQLTQFLASVYITLDDLDLHSEFTKLYCKIVSHPAPAAYNNLSYLSLMLSEHTEKPFHLTVRNSNVKSVAFPYLII